MISPEILGEWRSAGQNQFHKHFSKILEYIDKNLQKYERQATNRELWTLNRERL